MRPPTISPASAEPPLRRALTVLGWVLVVACLGMVALAVLASLPPIR